MATPFTVTADCDLDAATSPWLVEQGADVAIARGEVPDALSDGVDAGGLAWQCAGDRVLIVVPCGIRFLVEGGETIRYEVEDGVGAADLRLFLLGTAWPVLAMQRGLLPLHASAIADGADVHAFSGASATGKSTLAAALAVRGHSFFADDVVLIDPNRLDGEAFCWRYEDLKLWPKALALVGVSGAGLVREVADFDKRYAVAPNFSPRVDGRLRTLRVLEKSYALGTPLRNTPLRGNKALRAVYDAIHRRPYAVAIFGRARLFEWSAHLLRLVDVSIFQRSVTPARFDEEVAALSRKLAAGS